MYGASYSNGGTPVWGENGGSTVRLGGQSVTSPRGPAGKFAKQFVEKTSPITFNATEFAMVVNAIGGRQMQPRVMEIVKALITDLAMQYDAGIVNSATADAKRLRDSIEQWNMASGLFGDAYTDDSDQY